MFIVMQMHLENSEVASNALSLYIYTYLSYMFIFVQMHKQNIRGGI